MRKSKIGQCAKASLSVQLFYLLSCATPMSTMMPDLHGTVDREWAVAQEVLEGWGVPAHRIKPMMFNWHTHDGPFPCGKVERANGCFSPQSYSISYNTQTPQVIRHESTHAILYRLGYECWRCVSIDGIGEQVTVSDHGCPPERRCKWMKTINGLYSELSDVPLCLGLIQ